VKFQIKITSGHWENGEKLKGATFFAAPCREGSRRMQR